MNTPGLSKDCEKKSLVLDSLPTKRPVDYEESILKRIRATYYETRPKPTANKRTKKISKQVASTFQPTP
eukprot:Pgem_evm1s5246